MKAIPPTIAAIVALAAQDKTINVAVGKTIAAVAAKHYISGRKQICFLPDFLISMENTEEVWKRFSGEMLGYFLARVKERATAEDLRQEVFLRIHEHLPSLKERSKLGNWISVLARNVLADHWKKTIRDRTEKEPMSMEEERNDTVKEMAEKCVRDMLETLPGEYAHPVILSELEGWKQKQVAEKLGLSYSGAKSRVQRGRELLRKAIISCCRPELNARGELVSSRCLEDGEGCREQVCT